MIDLGMRLAHTWTSKTNVDKAIIDFDRTWATLTSFLASPPVVKLTCDYLWDIFYEVRACQGDLAIELKKSAIEERYVDSDSSSSVQFRFVAECIVHNLTIADKVGPCKTALVNALSPILKEDIKHEFPEDLLREISDFLALVQCSAQSSDPRRLQVVLGSVPIVASRSADRPFTSLLKKFPVAGTPIIKDAEDVLKSQTENRQIVQLVSDRTEVLRKLGADVGNCVKTAETSGMSTALHEFEHLGSVAALSCHIEFLDSKLGSEQRLFLKEQEPDLYKSFEAAFKQAMRMVLSVIVVFVELSMIELLSVEIADLGKVNATAAQTLLDNFAKLLAQVDVLGDPLATEASIITRCRNWLASFPIVLALRESGVDALSSQQLAEVSGIYCLKCVPSHNMEATMQKALCV
jgi:hypothetical protein